ncbi:MAG: hypothetical protein HYY49_12535 [Ignavibacteriales bacterium]|nr:hypothetical protein [Ignavibacteriales bacterium]
MGLYPQPNHWQCGPFALKHALVSLGIFADEKSITKIAGSNWWHGTNEIQLGKAARRFECKMLMIRRHDAEQARKELSDNLRRGIPTLLCVDQWGHWVTAVKVEQGKFIVLDSADKAVLTIATWNQLKKWWVYKERDELDRSFTRTIYDFHPIVPKFRLQTKARFSIARARYLLRKENRALALLWDEYISDLLTLCKPRTALSEKVFSLGEFFRRHESMILDQVTYWHGGMKRQQARKILDHMHFIADTYGLIIHVEDEKRVIAGITAILSLWAAGRFGANRVYETQPKTRKR